MFTKMPLYTILLYFTTLTTIVQSLPDYQAQIPNGHKVGHPCFANTVWKGVGHKYHGGGGFLNSFGEDFRDNSFKWDSCICEYDSDGDGRTNGEELGDPYCVWSLGDLPQFTDDITHPGVCEPLDDIECQMRNDWNECEPMEFDCEGLGKPGSDVMELRFDEMIIPSESDPYYCKHFKFDADEDLQAFAMEPYLVNADLVHHIDMYECENPDEIDANQPPQPCGAMSGCGGNMLAAWAVGINGLCMNEDVGIRIGKYGAKAASLRIHYHNPNIRVNESDSSGLKFHVTSNIRPNDAMVLNLGQMYLEIPPGQVEHEEVIWLTDECTQYFAEDVYFAFGSMHMHYLGIGGYTELWRDGRKVQDIMSQDFYDYNAPHIQNFDPPVHIKRGDSIKHVCRFQSRERSNVTWRGQAATAEMCHVYFVHYPVQNISHAFNSGARAPCNFRNGQYLSNWDSVCDKTDFDHIYNTYMKAELQSVCDTTGKTCQEGCKEKLEWAFNNHSCLAEDVRSAIFANKGEMKWMQHSCREYPPIVPVATTTTRPEGECVLESSSGASALHIFSSIFYMASFLLVFGVA